MEIKKLNKITKVYYLNEAKNTVKITGINSGYTKFICEFYATIFNVALDDEAPIIGISSKLFDINEIDIFPKAKGFLYGENVSIIGYDCFFSELKIYQNVSSNINGDYDVKVNNSNNKDYDYVIALYITFDC